jgi:Tfp pilus assembly protein PilN
VKAVNLIPRDARRGSFSPSMGNLGASHLLIGILVAALAMTTLYVLSANTVNQRKAQLASLNQQVSRVQAEVTRLQAYQSFEKLAQARAATVKEIAASRFNWQGALSDLSKVMPAKTNLQALVATVSTTTSGGGTAGGASGNVRADVNAPAFVLKGCTRSQNEVAQLMGQLHLINGVSRVTLEDSNQAASTGSSTAAASAGSCSGPTFDLVVFFQPLAGAAATLNGVPTSGTAGGHK